MTWHILGWSTVALQAGITAALLPYMVRVGHIPYVFAQKLPVPRIVDAPLSLNSDYAGLV